MNSSKKTSVNTIVTSIGILMILVGLGVSYFLELPQLQSAQTERNTAIGQQKGLTRDVQTLTTASTQLIQAKNDLEARGIDLTLASQVYPAYEDIPGLYLQMEDIIHNRAIGLSNTDYTVGPPQSGATGVQIPVTFTATGSYPNLKQFITVVETNVRPVSLTSVAFVTDPKDESQMTVSLVGYVQAAALSPAYAPPKS